MTQAVGIESLASRLHQAIEEGGRLGLLSAHRMLDGRSALLTLVLWPATAEWQLWETEVPAEGYPSITLEVPQAHWFERLVYDMFGLQPLGHPRLKSVILHEAWPAGFCPLRDEQVPQAGERRSYTFMTVKGEGVYEIPVGPIHAGIIEPGHFRFSCLGEIVENLEIRLGYQHRGVEERMTRIPWRNARFLAEAISSDTVVGNALAHARAMENLLGIEPPRWASVLRCTALEVERVASHIGDLGGICADIGYAGGATVFGRLRGVALGLGEKLSGSRFMTAFVVPGGVARALPEAMRCQLSSDVEGLVAEVESSLGLLLDNVDALDRMQFTGRLKHSLAASFGLVGPAGRASGVEYDVRASFAEEAHREAPFHMALDHEGDVLARVRVRADELRNSLQMIAFWLREPLQGACLELPSALPPQKVGVGLVESWRGELIHLVRTDRNGQIRRYCVKDPSFNNWTGLAIAVRGQLVTDFPLCNKSFSLSYSGNDL